MGKYRFVRAGYHIAKGGGQIEMANSRSLKLRCDFRGEIFQRTTGWLLLRQSGRPFHPQPPPAAGHSQSLHLRRAGILGDRSRQAPDCYLVAAAPASVSDAGDTRINEGLFNVFAAKGRYGP